MYPMYYFQIMTVKSVSTSNTFSSKNHRSRDRKSPFLIPSAQRALECKAHQDIICIDGSHEFGWFWVGCCGDLRNWGVGGTVDLPGASSSVSSTSDRFFLEISTWLKCLMKPKKGEHQVPQLCRFQKTTGHVTENRRF